jgi:excisionase family DNA binding protein
MMKSTNSLDDLMVTPRRQAELQDLTIDQCCHVLMVSRSTVWRLLQSGVLSAYRISRSVRVHRESIEALRNATSIKRGVR